MSIQLITCYICHGVGKVQKADYTRDTGNSAVYHYWDVCRRCNGQGWLVIGYGICIIENELYFPY